jgi:hypothetical protein
MGLRRGGEDANANLAARHRDFVVGHRLDVLDDDSEPPQLPVELVAKLAAELWQRTVAVAFVDGIAPVDEGANLRSNCHGASCEIRSGSATTMTSEGRSRGRGASRASRTTATIGSELIATPTAEGRKSPIAWPTGLELSSSPLSRLFMLARHGARPPGREACHAEHTINPLPGLSPKAHARLAQCPRTEVDHV